MFRFINFNMFESSLSHMNQVFKKKIILSNLLKRCSHRNIKNLNGFEKIAEQLQRQHFGAADISDTFTAFAPGHGPDRHHQRTFAFWSTLFDGDSDNVRANSASCQFSMKSAVFSAPILIRVRELSIDEN